MKTVVRSVFVVSLFSAAVPLVPPVPANAAPKAGYGAGVQSKAAARELGDKHHLKGHGYWEKGQREKALVEFRLALKYVSDWSDVYTDVGDILDEMGDVKWNADQIDAAWALYKQADTAYKQAVNADPNYARARFNYGIFLTDQAWSEPYRGAPAAKVKALHNAAIAQLRRALEMEPDNPSYHLQLAKTLEAAGYKPLARKEYERVAASSNVNDAKQAQAALVKYKAEDRKLEQARLQNLRNASGTLLRDHIAKGRLDARDLYFLQLYKAGHAMSFQQPNTSWNETPVKPTPEREKLLRQLALSFQPLQKSTTPVNTIRPGDLIVDFTAPKRYGTVAVVQSVGTSRNEMVIATLMFDEGKSEPGITKSSVPLSRIKSEDSYFVLRPLDTKFLPLLAQSPK